VTEGPSLLGQNLRDKTLLVKPPSSLMSWMTEKVSIRNVTEAVGKYDIEHWDITRLRLASNKVEILIPPPKFFVLEGYVQR